jgi:hypothetical protein
MLETNPATAKSSTTTEPPLWFTVTQAQQTRDPPFSRNTVYRALATGKVLTRKFGSSRLINRPSWLAFLDGHPGVDPDLPEEYQQTGRVYFARSPGSDVWVWFGDLPEGTRTALWQRYKSRLMFPAGLPLAGIILPPH